MASPSPPIRNVIVGTAGHIDHGKSSLVQRLTGIDPDRLQEEKDRGMTIDLGFARLQLGDSLIGIIDVPGHERFIKNMVAGATSVDVVVLVVAADDGVMPQTREHLEILTLLGLKSGLVALTKADLVDEDLLELALDDVRSLLQGTFLEDAQVLPCSSATGAGLDAVRDELARLVERVQPRSTEGLFRMPIQRVFSAKGHGTVVTGVPLGGALDVGQMVEILPLHQRGKVRGMQAYGAACSTARAGHSCALNLADINYHDVHRGMVVAEPGYFEEAQLFEARLHYLAGRSAPLDHRSPVRFHVGTSEIMGRVRIIDAEHLLPGESGLVQVELEEPVTAVAGDRFLVRQPSPMVTLGGGVLLGATRHHRRRLKDYHVIALQEREEALASPRQAVLFNAEQRRFTPFSRDDLAVDLSLPRGDVDGLVGVLVEEGELSPVGRDQLLSRLFVERAETQVREELTRLHAAQPLKKLLEVRQLRSALELADSVLKTALQRVIATGEVVEEGEPGHLRLSRHQPSLSAADEALLDRLRQVVQEGGLKPPAPADCAGTLGAETSKVIELLNLLQDIGEAVRIGALYFHREAVDHARRELVDNAKAHGGLVAIPDLRDVLQTSRKFMIPLLEYFDAQRVTVRRGDQRFLKDDSVQ